MKYACVSCGRRTANRSKRCSRCTLPPRPRGNAFEPTRREVFERARGICHLCGEPVRAGQRWHVDHVKPRARGGADSIENYALAHEGCNLRKGARTLPLSPPFQ